MANDNWGAGDNFATGFFSSVGDALQDKVKQQRDNDQKLKDQQAQVYLDAIKSGRLSPDQIAYSQQQLQKIYGNSKPMKELFQKVGNVLHIGHHVSQQQAQGGGPTPPPTMSEQTPIGGSSTQPPGMMPAAMTLPGKTPPPGGATPIPSGTDANPSGAPPTVPMGGPTPPPTFASVARAAYPSPDTLEGEKISGIKREMDARKGIARDLGLKTGSSEYNEYVATGKWPTATRIQKSQMVDKRNGQPLNFDPETGAYTTQDGLAVPPDQVASAVDMRPKPFQYQGPNGEALIGWTANGKYLDQEGKELPDGTIGFHPSLSPTDSSTTTVRIVKNADGSYSEIPVTSTTVKTRGGAGATGASAGPTPPPKSTAASSGGTGKPPAKPHARGRGAGAGAARTVMGPDGKPLMGPAPTEVKKAYDTYNAAQERYAVMQDALPRAMKGDQQAMVNLLANHIGMTMGLQKGARITQSIYNEAMASAPWSQRIASKFKVDDSGNVISAYRTGVTLAPEQMTQMIELAKVRLQQDQQAWQREVATAKSGYGMNDGGANPPAASGGPAPPPGPPPRTAEQYLQSLGR